MLANNIITSTRSQPFPPHKHSKPNHKPFSQTPFHLFYPSHHQKMAHNTTATDNRRMLASSTKPNPSTVDDKQHIPELTKLFSKTFNSFNHKPQTTKSNQKFVTNLDTHLQVRTNPDVQISRKSTKNSSQNKDSTTRGYKNEQEVVKLHYPIKEAQEETKRLSSGALVKIKELKVSSYDDEDNKEHESDDDGKKKRPSMGIIDRRKSFCGSKSNYNSAKELSDFLSSHGARIVSVDMPPFMQIHAVGCARKVCDSLEKFTSKAVALTLKKEFDGVYGPAWHCIVGTSFGSFVTHSVGGFIYFSMDHKLCVLLFKTSVQKAD